MGRDMTEVNAVGRGTVTGGEVDGSPLGTGVLEELGVALSGVGR